MGSLTSSSLWNAVQESFGVINKSRVTFLINELQRTRKGKNIFHNDLVTQVLDGLDEEYTPIVVRINSRESISWHELQSVLMTYESLIEHLNAVKNSLASVYLSQASANFVLRSSFNIGSRSNFGGKSFNYKGGRGRARGSTNEGSAAGGEA
ncbi:unnamed protein product [Fraxinus pennsylvanica]|uniref:Uncharacterized protein n=1 Tax=Fraxinus pennsylvanica TaxID=56036 RepID=A0AAD2E6B0_9LAMI|nr:unnamed protein product [Fraxinus pennsylvanica]